MCYQVTQIEIDTRPRLQKIHNMFKIKAVAKLANKVMEEILEEKDLNITELNHSIYATATVITEEINGRAQYKIEKDIKTTTLGQMYTGEHIWHQKGTASVGGNKKR